MLDTPRIDTPPDEDSAIHYLEQWDELDEELAHTMADNLIANIVEKLGYARLATAYRERCKKWWYA